MLTDTGIREKAVVRLAGFATGVLVTWATPLLQQIFSIEKS